MAKKNLLDIITKIEPKVKENNNIVNISLFSGKYFLEYLHYYERYVTIMDNNPFIILYDLFNEYNNNWFIRFNYIKQTNFKEYIVKTISGKIQDNFGKIGNEEAPKIFRDNIKNAFNELYKNKKLNNFSISDEDELINKFYNINILLKKEDIFKTKYSKLFFNDLENVISKAECLQKKNFILNSHDFFDKADKLFYGELKAKQENAEIIYRLFMDELIPEVIKELKIKEYEIKEEINRGKNECIQIINHDKNDAENILKNFDDNLESVRSDLKNRISEKINEMKENQERIANKIIEDIKKRVNEKIKSFYNSQNLYLDSIQHPIDEQLDTFETFARLFNQSIYFGFGVGFGVGISYGSITLSALFGGLVGIFGAVVISLIISLGYMIFSKKRKYIKFLENCERELMNKFEEMEYSFFDHYKTFKDILINELKLQTEIYFKKMNGDEIEWKEIKEQYENIKSKTLETLKKLGKFNLVDFN